MPSIDCFPYLGPGRRSDKTVIEITLNFGPGEFVSEPTISELSMPAASIERLSKQVRRSLEAGGVLQASDTFPREVPGDGPQPGFMSLLVQTALLIQQKAGHRVDFFSVLPVPKPNQCVALLEYDHCDVGMTAVKLAYEVLTGQRKLLAEPFRMFKAFARERCLPLDAEAIKRAAGRRDIPCMLLERNPFFRTRFDELTEGDCIRLNGLLMLGHGPHQHVLDGTFCLDKSTRFKPLLKDQSLRHALLDELSIPVFREAGDDQAGSKNMSFIVIGGRIILITEPATGENLAPGDVHDSLCDHVLAISHAVDQAPVVVTLAISDISGPLLQGEGVVDFDMAPRFEEILAAAGDIAPSLLDRCAMALVEWLFPTGSPSRMPIIAITGTNGKTTTTRMVTSILTAAGRKPGMVCTDGIFLNGRQVNDGDMCTIIGHVNVLTSKAVDVAVLETHHNGILKRGFAFRHCDVAICLNVSEDHLGNRNIDTVGQMAELKQALPVRAAGAAILNADNAYCLAMLDAMVADDIWLVSMQQSVEALIALAGDSVSCFCVLESVDNSEWIVLYDHGQRHAVIDAAAIPATFEAKARFNISNAMHAVVACYQLETPIEVMRAVLGDFEASQENTPGRLNVFDQLPFRIIMDFAHNPEGMEVLRDFIDTLEVTGRKVLAFAGTANRTEEQIKNKARAVAGHFDFYYCKEHVSEEVELRKVAHILKQALLDSGVREDQTAIKGYGRDVIFEIFDSCQPDDLLVVLSGNIEKHYLGGYIEEYAAKLEKSRV